MSIPLRQPLQMAWIWTRGRTEFWEDELAKMLAEAINVRGVTQLIAEENPMQFQCRGDELMRHNVTSMRIWTFGKKGELLQVVTK